MAKTDRFLVKICKKWQISVTVQNICHRSNKLQLSKLQRRWQICRCFAKNLLKGVPALFGDSHLITFQHLHFSRPLQIFPQLSLLVHKHFVILHRLHPEAPLVGGTVWRWRPIYRKKRYLRFVLDTWESGSFQLTVKNKATKNAHGYVIPFSISRQPSLALCFWWFRIYILAWASALLVQLLGRCQSLHVWDE